MAQSDKNKECPMDARDLRILRDTDFASRGYSVYDLLSYFQRGTKYLIKNFRMSNAS
jgi:hypothetical protein